MPAGLKIVPLRPARVRRRGTTAERGYGSAHQRQRAGLLKDHPVCQRCGADWSRHLHHRDRDTFNRSAENAEALCEPCHQAEHAGC